MSLIKYLLGIAFLLHLQTFQLQGQSLLEDTEDFLAAVQQLRDQQANTSDSAKVAATANLLSILYHYDQSIAMDSLMIGSWDELVATYADNAMINTFLSDSLLVLPDSLIELAIQESRWQLRSKQAEPRQKIIRLLHAEQAIAPSQYLSVSNTLERYRLPPVKAATSMQLAAQESNANINNGILNSVAVIRGMFQFVLDKAKDEVVVNFLERMLNQDSPDFIVLFPNVVGQFSNQDFTYSNSFVERLRDAFYQDFQQLSVRLPMLLLEDDYFKPLQSNPIAYNLLATYSMIGMAQKEVPVEEILPVTHRYLHQSYGEAMKTVNLEIAEKAIGSIQYDSLISLTHQMVGRMKAIYLDLDKSEYALRDTIRHYRSNFVDTIPAPFANDYLRREAYDLEVLLGGSDDGAFDLSLLPYLLAGQLDSAYTLGYNTLESYDKFFGKERSPQQWRAAGLELANKLNGTWYQEQSIANIFRTWQKDIARYQEAVDEWKVKMDPQGALRNAMRQANRDRKELRDSILSAKQFWSEATTYDDRLAFELLARIIKDFNDIEFKPELDLLEDAEAELIKLALKKEKLLAVQDRAVALDQRMRSKSPGNFRASPIQLYLKSKEGIVPYAALIAQIAELTNELELVDQQIDVLEEQFSKVESRARDNAKPIMQTTEITTQLLYGLRTGGAERKWLSVGQIDTLLDGGNRQNIFLGLLTQRLSNVKNVGLFSPSGIAQLVELTVSDLRNLPSYIERDSLVEKDSLAFYHKAAFAVNTINRILELPLMVQKNNPLEFQPLKEQLPGLARVPDITNQTLDFIYYLNVKDHRHAMSSMLRLFGYLDADIGNAGKKGKRKSAINYLHKYGDFIADLIDAEERGQVEDLLTNISDPPGSSRLKRKQQLTVGLNAYVGGTVGWEQWSGPELSVDDDGYLSLAPSIPIGITMSSLVGERRGSFSLFISFLDLGGLLTFRADDAVLGESIFNFKNIFKPGIQLHWNIKKSPFYLALGGQYGPQYRKINGEEVSLESVRYFLGFGVDVPIKTLYQK